eukprot:TRINITY_DN10681_c1_g1_i3.p1 TRINITY_DN10681_c1_g1~~TRINITY_DN10681_c1_g1_i3.p1  ORF type:complete len:251 (+),score=23.54 TRINITY_DN10681_c1_g1_i3:107-859(+)
MAYYDKANKGIFQDLERGDFSASYEQNWEKEVRKGFVRKVFGILSVQLIVTTLISTIFLTVQPIKEYIKSPQGVWAFWLAWVITLVLIIAMACSEDARRKHPTNLMMLGAFTLAESYLVGVISAQFDTELVLLAFGITAAITISLTLFAMQTKYDFTTCGGLLLGLLIGFLLTTILGSIFFRDRIWVAAVSGFGAFLFSAYLVFDIQLVMGGRKYELGPDEYVFAALNLYLDIINIFLYILQLLNAAQNN